MSKTALTADEKVQHTDVLQTAKQNLGVVTGQLETLKHERYDEVLEVLDTASRMIDALTPESA